MSYIYDVLVPQYLFQLISYWVDEEILIVAFLWLDRKEIILIVFLIMEWFFPVNIKK